MLGLYINGEPLDLSPGTTAQLERASPFFSDDSLEGEYSLPFTFSYTPRNARLLGLPNHYYTRRIKKKIAAWLYDNNNFAYSGELVIETANLDVNDISKSSISGYFLTGVSSFFQAVKKKKLKELQLGGVQTFAWTDDDVASPVKGWWQYVHDTLNGGMAITFAPIRNEMWAGNNEPGSPDFMNKMGEDGNLLLADNYNTLAPQVSLKYVLEKIFEEHGWTFDASAMNDDQWSILYMPSFFSVTWMKVSIEPPTTFFIPLENISLNLQNHVPPEMKITELIIALRKRYNWGFEFNSSSKQCRMIPLKGLVNGVRKDWTQYMTAKWTSDFSEDEKIFAFQNDIDNNDALSSAPDFSKVQYGDPVEKVADLPAPVEANFGKVIYCWKENQYYQNNYNEDDDIYEWQIFADGIYNYEPEGHNEDIVTVASTMPMYKTLFRTDADPTDFFIQVPLCEQQGNWDGKVGEFIPWGLRLLFFRGRVYEANPIGNIGTVRYPLLTSLAFTITQEEPDLAWSNVYVHTFDGNDKGIVKYWWADTLKYLNQSEVMSGNLKLPRQELKDFRWSDIILLRNIPYITQRLQDTIPNSGIVPVKMRRIG